MPIVPDLAIISVLAFIAGATIIQPALAGNTTMGRRFDTALERFADDWTDVENRVALSIRRPVPAPGRDAAVEALVAARERPGSLCPHACAVCRGRFARRRDAEACCHATSNV